MKIKLLIMLLPLLASAAFSQKPCTNEDAYQKIGGWGKQKSDSIANADISFPAAQYPAVLPKAQKVIEFLKQANPQPIGIKAFAYSSMNGNSYTPNGALPYGVTAMYMGYLCMSDTPGASNPGQIMLGGETETWVYVNFNNLGWLANERLSLGENFPTVDGKIMFELPKQIGELKGLALLRPALDAGRRDEAVIITSDNRSPYKPVTREAFLKAFEKFYQRNIKKCR